MSGVVATVGTGGKGVFTSGGGATILVCGGGGGASTEGGGGGGGMRFTTESCASFTRRT